MAKATSKTKTKKAKTAPKKTAATATKSARGTRYTPKERAAIILFVDKFNAKNSRGGAAEAARKYGITQLTISKWMLEAGSPSPKRKNSADFSKTISRLTKVHTEMAELQTKLDALKKEYVQLKSVL